MANTVTYPERVDEFQVQNAGIGDLPASNGGVVRVAIAAAKATNTVIKSTAGRLCRVLVTTAGTTALQFNDGDGTIIGLVPSTATAGQVFDFQIPATQSITAVGNAGNPAVTVTYL